MHKQAIEDCKRLEFERTKRRSNMKRLYSYLRTLSSRAEDTSESYLPFNFSQHIDKVMNVWQLDTVDGPTAFGTVPKIVTRRYEVEVYAIDGSQPPPIIEQAPMVPPPLFTVLEQPKPAAHVSRPRFQAIKSQMSKAFGRK